jgi:hypothetical protein
MFIKIKSTNYFVPNADEKSVREIFEIIFCRMEKNTITSEEKIEMYKAIFEQLKNH